MSLPMWGVFPGVITRVMSTGSPGQLVASPDRGPCGEPSADPRGQDTGSITCWLGGGGIEAGAAAWPCLQVGPSACRRRCLGAPFRCWGLSTRNRFVARAAPCPTLGGAGAWSCTSASTGSFQLSPSSTPRKGRRAAVPASTGGGEKRSRGRARGAEPLSRSARRAGGHLHFQVRGFSASLGTFCLPASRHLVSAAVVTICHV